LRWNERKRATGDLFYNHGWTRINTDGKILFYRPDDFEFM